MNLSDIFYIGLLLNGLLCNAVRIFGEFYSGNNKIQQNKNKAEKAFRAFSVFCLFLFNLLVFTFCILGMFGMRIYFECVFLVF